MYFSGETKCKRVSDKKEIRLDEIPEDKYNKREIYYNITFAICQ